MAPFSAPIFRLRPQYFLIISLLPSGTHGVGLAGSGWLKHQRNLGEESKTDQSHRELNGPIFTYQNMGKGQCVDPLDRTFSRAIIKFKYFTAGAINKKLCAYICNLFEWCIGFSWAKEYKHHKSDSVETGAEYELSDSEEEDMTEEEKKSFGKKKITCEIHFCCPRLAPWREGGYRGEDQFKEDMKLQKLEAKYLIGLLLINDKGHCEIDDAMVNVNGESYPHHRCFKKKPAPKCCRDGWVNCDPIFLGLRGQIFKFDGRDNAWYANIASKQLQWNIQFGQFSSCPKDRNMYVTGTSMQFFDNDVFKRNKPAHSIVIKVASKYEYFPGCSSGENVCLANGSLVVILDGHHITAPGDYSFSDGYGRVIAHNVHGLCSRKWHDYRGNKDKAGIHEVHQRKLRLKNRPIDYLLDDQEYMLDPDECNDWLDKRVQNDDLFEQEGDWATIHIETPLVSFHVEYRKNTNDKECMSHSIDAWISRASPDLEEQTWQGILGETAQPKFDLHGNEIKYDRAKLLSAKDDEAYEVDGELGREFRARDESWM